MTEQPQHYLNREIDEFLKELRGDLCEIKKQTTITNGKVRKITITIAILVGIIAGITGKDIVVPVLLSLL